MHASQDHHPRQEGRVVYPESDGKPMADNTRQARWITTIKGDLDARLPDFVAMDLFWYPVEGHPEIVQAPDVLIALGRPKGDRPSYKQWEEGGQAPQVVFEILSPSNRLPEMIRKQRFYEQHGVEEYYVYDPDTDALFGWIRQGAELAEIPHVDGWASPRLGIRFDLSGSELVIRDAQGQRFETFEELHAGAWLNRPGQGEAGEEQRDRGHGGGVYTSAGARGAGEPARCAPVVQPLHTRS